MKIFLGNRVLAGGIGEQQEPFDMALEFTGLLQVASFLRASHATPIDRGNRTAELRFSVLRRHGSVAEATEFLLTHGAGLADLEGTARLHSEGPSRASFQLSPAVLRRVQGVQEGTTTTHSYTIVGGILDTTTEEN
jgi:hypothetical protein